MEQTPQQKLTLRTAATTSPNISEGEAGQKTILWVREKYAERIGRNCTNIFLKMEESWSQTMLKLEADWANRELAITKMKLETKKMIAKEKTNNEAGREFAMMKLKLETRERIAKKKRESEEIIATQNIISFQLEIRS
jgi:hypothetical protein